MELKLSDFERLQMSCTMFLSCKSCCLGTNLFQPQQAFAGLDNLSQSNILISLIPSCLATLYGEMSSSQLARLVEWAVFWEKPLIIIIVFDMGEKIAEYQSTIFFSLICDLLFACIIIIIFFFWNSRKETAMLNCGKMHAVNWKNFRKLKGYVIFSECLCGWNLS